MKYLKTNKMKQILLKRSYKKIADHSKKPETDSECGSAGQETKEKSIFLKDPEIPSAIDNLL